MYPYNNSNNNSPMPSARLPSRPRYGGGEEYPMQQVSFNNNSPPPPPFPSSPNDTGFYDGNDVQRPLLVNNGSTASSVTLNNGNGGNVRFTNAKSNMIGGGPDNVGIAPRKQTRRYKTSKIDTFYRFIFLIILLL